MNKNKNIITFATLLLITIWVLNATACRHKENNIKSLQYYTNDEDSTPISQNKFKGVRLISSQKKFNIPESAIIDTKNDYIYISNINGQPDEKNGTGYITRIMISGEIIDTLPITNLNAPKGMAIANGKLFIADIDRVIEYNIENKQIDQIYQPEDAQFLNDITTDADNNVYITDTQIGCLYKITNKNIKKILNDSLCNNANGLCRADAKIAMAAANSIIIIDPINTHRYIFAKLHFTPDGIKYHNDSTFIVSDFIGNIYAVTQKKCSLIVAARNGVNSADFEYLPQQNILIVPTFFNNSIDIYEINLD